MMTVRKVKNLLISSPKSFGSSCTNVFLFLIYIEFEIRTSSPSRELAVNYLIYAIF